MSMRSLILCVATLVPSVAMAQSQPGGSSETGTLITSRPAEIRGATKVDARLTLRQFGNCTLRRTPQVAVQVINLPVDEAEFDKTIRRIASEDCLVDGDLHMPPSLLRGALFEALYLRDFGRAVAPALKGVPSFDYAQGYSRPLSPAAQNAIGLAVVADCVARTSPIAAHEFITSLPGSKLEDRAFTVVGRLLPGCVPPNQTFKFSRSVVRSSVAEAMYRLSGVARGQGGQGS